MILHIHDCENVSNTISQYGLGTIISEAAQEVMNMFGILMGAIGDAVNKKDANVKITGLVDATPFKTGIINYEDSNITLTDISNFEYSILDNNAPISKYKVIPNGKKKITIKKGPNIKTQEELALARAFQVYEKLDSSNIFNRSNITTYAKMGEDKKDPAHRGIFIEINFPHALDTLLKNANKEALDILKMMATNNDISDSVKAHIVDSMGIKSILNTLERLPPCYDKINLSDLQYTFLLDTSFVIPNLIFKKGSTEIMDSLAEISKETINEITKFMIKYPHSEIIISGHTDTGDERTMEKLSENRAKKIKSFLVDKGIIETKIKTKWYGYNDRLVKTDNAKNRRVEIKFTKVCE